MKTLLFHSWLWFVCMGTVPAFGAPDEHRRLALYLSEAISENAIDLGDIEKNPDAWLEEFIRLYRVGMSRGRAGTDPDGLSVPFSGAENRLSVLKKLSESFKDKTDTLYPLLKEILQKDPSPIVRRTTYSLFRALSNNRREQWATETYERILDFSSHIMENALLYRAAVAVEAQYSGIPAAKWTLGATLIADIPNIERALESEGVTADLSEQWKQRELSPLQDYCVMDLLENWSHGERKAAELSPPASSR